ncbi:hypothetical protein ACNRBV_10400 [Ralstonia pseudosolanacearum]|uniref:hypothetical protein n=1 Tax=Ralstonia pseudosolanacearum TaxID=1310165 RepID=UPI0018A61104|nr:hypothetical protein [Ralstonia pseudosolanacearum]BCL92128.1 hypothetical protein MAFF211479_18290 [Ralstonia solanacearum]BCN04692.1 hypothetical protein RPSB_18290 [Ralstonia solanacearum]BCN10105.1 hypothetical protein RPSD_19900 [Ralstonia solanacearum]
MDKHQARQTAYRLLVKLIENQPNLFQFQSGPDEYAGRYAAQFCENFLNTFSEALLKEGSTVPSEGQ